MTVIDARLWLLPDPDLDDDQRERLTRGLRAELAELDVEEVRSMPAGPAPPGTKVADPVTIGALVVAMSASGGVFTAVISTVRDWLARQAGRHRVTVTIDGDTIVLQLSGLSSRHGSLKASPTCHTKLPRT